MRVQHIGHGDVDPESRQYSQLRQGAEPGAIPAGGYRCRLSRNVYPNLRGPFEGPRSYGFPSILAMS